MWFNPVIHSFNTSSQVSEVGGLNVGQMWSSFRKLCLCNSISVPWFTEKLNLPVLFSFCNTCLSLQRKMQQWLFLNSFSPTFNRLIINYLWKMSWVYFYPYGNKDYYVYIESILAFLNPLLIGTQLCRLLLHLLFCKLQFFVSSCLNTHFLQFKIDLYTERKRDSSYTFKNKHSPPISEGFKLTLVLTENFSRGFHPFTA